MNANTINNKTKCKGKKKIKHNNVTRKLKYMESVGGRRRKRNKGMMDGGDPFDTLGYRTKRDQDRLADETYQRSIIERKKSHEITKNMITLKDGKTTLVNFPKNTNLFSYDTNPIPRYQVTSKDGKSEPTPEQKKELQQILAEKDEEFKKQQKRDDEQEEKYERDKHEAAEAAEEAKKISLLADQVAATPAVVLPSSTDAAAAMVENPPLVSEDNTRKRMREPDETESNDVVKRQSSLPDVSTPLENTAASDVIAPSAPSSDIAPSDIARSDIASSAVIASAPLESAATDTPPNLDATAALSNEKINEEAALSAVTAPLQNVPPNVELDSAAAAPSAVIAPLQNVPPNVELDSAAANATSLSKTEAANQLQTIEAPPAIIAPNVPPLSKPEMPPQSSTPSADADADDAAKQQKLAEIKSKLDDLTRRYVTLKEKTNQKKHVEPPLISDDKNQQTVEQQQQQEPSQITVEPSQITVEPPSQITQGGEKHKNKQKKKTLYKKYKSNASLKRRHKTCKNQ